MQVLKESGVFFEELGLLAVSDLQLGHEAVLAAQGIQVPISQYPQIEAALAAMLDETGAKRLLINGDIKHEFSRALQQEWSEVHALLRFLKARKVATIFVKGNHDNYVAKILRAQELSLVDAYQERGFLFVHGHQALEDYPDFKSFAPFKTLVIGHVHPAVSIRDEVGVLHKYRCALSGKWRGKNVVVLPSLSPLAGGFDVTRRERERDYVSPILDQCRVGDFVPFVIDEDAGVREFPLVRHLG